jgi:hypothetical protein
MGFPSVTLLILNFNGMRYIENCLNSVVKTDYPGLRVIVIDNGSQDESADFIRKNYEQVELIQNQNNYGFAKAYNLVLDSVESDYVAILNNDVEVEPYWLKQLVNHATKKGRVAAANPKMLFLYDRTRVNSAGGSCDAYGVGWNRGNGEIDNHQYDGVEEVFYSNGAAMLINKSVWSDIGSFDERYFMYGEDLDWCWRARLKGYKILYVPEARIYHRWKGSNGAMIQFLERHQLATVIKNYSLKSLISIVPRWLALKVLKAMWLINHGTALDEKLAVFRAITWNLRCLRDTWERHLMAQFGREVSDKEVRRKMYHGSFELSLWSGKIRHPIVEN